MKRYFNEENKTYTELYDHIYSREGAGDIKKLGAKYLDKHVSMPRSPYVTMSALTETLFSSFF